MYFIHLIFVRMKPLLASIIGCLFFLVSACTAPDPFEGTWEYIVTDEMGDHYTGFLELVYAEDELNGTISNDGLALSMPISSVETNEQDLAFSFTAEGYGPIQVDVKVEGEALTGSFVIEALGPLPMKGIRLPDEAILEDRTEEGTLHQDPYEARIITEDIPRFWEAYDKSKPDFNPIPFAVHYLNEATPGLVGFIPRRVGGALNLSEVVKAHDSYYASIRSETARFAEMEPTIQASFARFKELYPDAVFPDVYIVMGALNTGGTVSETAIIMGAEMYAKSDQADLSSLNVLERSRIDPVESIHFPVVHELIHFQQKYASRTLLEQTIREGSADFLAELVMGEYGNTSTASYGEAREEELWNEFKEKMDGTDFSGWLYGGSAAGGRPPDLGYWMGYKITKRYYENAEDKQRAVREIIELTDARAFLEKSNYAARFTSGK